MSESLTSKLWEAFKTVESLQTNEEKVQELTELLLTFHEEMRAYDHLCRALLNMGFRVQDEGPMADVISFNGHITKVPVGARHRILFLKDRPLVSEIPKTDDHSNVSVIAQALFRAHYLKD